MVGIKYNSFESAPCYGGLKSSGGLMTPSEQVQVIANNYNFEWIRLGILIFEDNGDVAWDGSSTTVDLALSLGLRVQPVMVAYPTGTQQQFVPTADIPLWKSTIADILDTYDFESIVIGNEELNDSYYEEPLDNIGLYVGMLQGAYEVAHPRGVKVATGGFGNHSAQNVVSYRYVQAKYGTTAADAWATPWMPSFHINAAKNPDTNAGVEAFVTACEAVIAASDYYDYINVHKYEEKEPSDSAITVDMFRFYKEAFEGLTGRVFICNETGIWTDIPDDEDIGINQAALALNMWWEFYRQRVRHVALWDGRGNNAIPFSNNNTGALYPPGEAINTFLSGELP